MYDLSFPVCSKTGREKSIEELSLLDSRVEIYRGLAVKDVQSCFLEAEEKLSAGVPADLQKRLVTARELGTYGYFQWSFFTVSLFWSLTIIEMALRLKFHQVKPPPYVLCKKKQTRTENIPLWGLDRLFNKGWRVTGMNDFNGSFRSLMSWAVEEKLIPPDIPIHLQELRNRFNHRFFYEIFPKRALDKGLALPKAPTLEDIQALWNSLTDKERSAYLPSHAEILADEIPNLRNMLAHPGKSEWTFMPRSPVEGYRQAIEVINSLWA
jgi:hypothetical protein